MLYVSIIGLIVVLIICYGVYTLKAYNPHDN